MQLDDELLQIFLAEIASYQAILENGEAGLEDQAIAAHGLKGAAGMVGFAELQELARTLEHSLRDGDTGPRDAHLPRIREIIAAIAGGAASDDDALAAPPPEDPEPPADESSGFDAETMAMLQGIFLEEAADHLAAMEAALERLAADPGDAEAFHGLFRASHTLKGAAATVELHAIGRAAHLLEDRLEAIRDAGESVTPDEVERLICCAALLRSMVEAVEDPGRLKALHRDLAELLDAPLVTIPRTTAATTTDDDATDDDAADDGAADDDDMGWDAETRAILLETFHDEAAELLDELDPLVEELAGGSTSDIDLLFRLAHTLKGSAGAVGMGCMSKAAHALEDELETLRAGGDDRSPPDLTEVVASLRLLAPEPNDSPEARRLLNQVLDARDALRMPSRPHLTTLTTLPVAAAEPQSPQSPDSLAVTVERRARPERRHGKRRGDEERMIRVNAERLDALLNAVGEIVFRRTLIERRSEELTGLVRDLGASHHSLRAAVVALRDLRGAEQYAQRFSELEIEFADVLSNFDRAESGLREETEGLRKDAQYLQEGLTEIRLLSVRYLFARLRRSVRDIARGEGKQVTLQVQGENTEIDKVVAEKIADPMIQIIRNAVAHGIESPEERRAAGKPESGAVTITAVQEGNFVTLEVSDDGRGIDLESIRQALAEKGLMSADEARAAPDVEVTAAIFLPGLSTRRAADAVAGRGVGLDVVRDTIFKLGGEVTVHSERGRSTRFTVRMPLSTAVTGALLFKTGGEVFCIPIRWVAETRTTKTSDVLIHRGRDAVVHRDRTIPLLRLSDLLGTEARLMGKFLPTIILRHLDFEFALVVDKLIGPREIVLRELGPLLEPLDIYAAATISGAGKVQLVLDVPTLHEWASAWRTLPRAAHRAALPEAKQTRILVCDDSRSIREVVSRILQAEGYGVELANDGWDAWERMTVLRVDLLLTDLEMPRMDGYTLIEKVRKEDDFGGLPILVLTSRTGEDNQRRARRAGADGFLFKPVNRRVIISRVQELLRN
jgi:chemosensory pili system protein ChpA (sensor histidine kinase/response regulator)